MCLYEVFIRERNGSFQFQPPRRYTLRVVALMVRLLAVFSPSWVNNAMTYQPCISQVIGISPSLM